MKVAIVGSRDFDWYADRRGPDGEVPLNAHTHGMGRTHIAPLVYAMDNEDYVVSGGAQGADWWGEEYATNRNVGRIIHAAHWDKHGKAAGPIRNALIVRDADILFAFYTDRMTSRGTLNCVSQARQKGVPFLEYDAKTDKWYWNDQYLNQPMDHAYFLDKYRVIESSARPDVGA